MQKSISTAPIQIGKAIKTQHKLTPYIFNRKPDWLHGEKLDPADTQLESWINSDLAADSRKKE